MIVLAKLIGLLMICMGVAVILNPGLMKKMIAFWKKDKRVYAAGLLRVLFGIVFLLSATEAGRFPWVIYVLGVLLFLGAILIFILGLEKVKTMLEWWGKKPDSILRLMGILVLAIGVLVICSA